MQAMDTITIIILTIAMHCFDCNAVRMILISMFRQWTATANTKKLTSPTHRRLGREALVYYVTNLKIGDDSENSGCGGGGDGGVGDG